MTAQAAASGVPAPRTISVEEEMRKSYMDYAMSVIVSRALPDVRDGLKPVHRRILYAMEEGGYHSGKPYKKSARIVGDVMGKYHPHGDSAIYDTMVRMAQTWSMRVPLIDGQGNFGSQDGDPPAAMRYTEGRMSQAAHDMTVDIDRGTVSFRPTYDNTGKEPSVLPVRFPNLLVNGSAGIAVGMATNIPTHNMAEAIDACLLLIDNPLATINDVMAVMPGPDFPTGGVIMGRSGIRAAYETGRGSLVVSGVASIEEMKGKKTAIVITEFPYQVNKATFQEKVAELVNEKVLEGVVDIRDESDRDENVRVVIELRRDVDPNLVLNKLRKHTQFVTSFGVNAVCLDSRGKPTTMGVLQMLREFITFRRQVIRNRTIWDLDRARESLHKQIGLFAATSMIDEVVRTIRQSPDTDQARVRLMMMEFPTAGEFADLLRDADPDLEDVPAVFRLSDTQTTAILALSLRQLTGLERDRIADRARELSAQIHHFVSILNDSAVANAILRRELEEVRAKYAEPRRTRIEASELDALSEDDLVERKDVVLTLTHAGYVKITPLDAYREQSRGGKGKTGMETKDDDFVTTTLACSTRTPLIFFTSRGIAHALKAYKLPEAAPNAKGRPLVNYLPLRTSEGETISAALPLPEDPAELKGKYLIFVTDFGDVRRNDASDFADIRRSGKIAIRLDDEHGNPTGRLVNVLLCSAEDDVILATRKGMSIRFRVDDLRVMQSRTSSGVRGIALAEDDAVISATLLKHSDASIDERNAYLSGGVYEETRRVKPDDLEEAVPLGEHQIESSPWGTVTVSYEEAIDGGDLILKRRVELHDFRRAQMALDEQFLLTVSELGYGKRSSSYEFRITQRGGKGLACMNITKITGDLVSCLPVEETNGLVLVTDGGQTIRTRVREIRVQGRTTRGVTLFKMPDGQRIVDVTKVETGDETGGAD